MSIDSEDYDVVIIGGGPAGIAAASWLLERGIVPLVIDEQQRPGGQILRQSPWALNGRAPSQAWRAVAESPPPAQRAIEALRVKRDRFERDAGPHWLGGHSVVGLRLDSRVFQLTVTSVNVIRQITARAVLIATGCHELAVPLPGWTLPGVLGAGAFQTLIKGQLTLAGERTLFVGTHPLQLLVAAQTIVAGGGVAAVAFAQSRLTLLRSLFGNAAVVARHLPTLLPAMYAWRTLRKARVPVLFETGAVRIEGHEGVEGVQLSNGIRVGCDTVAQCYGFVPQADLPRQAGVRLRVAGHAGGWATEVDEWQATSLRGLFAAGETTGVAGAQGADLSGQLAALGIARYLGHISVAEAEFRASRVRRLLSRVKAFAAWLESLANPHGGLPHPEPDTLICRCEKVSYAKVRAGLDFLKSADALKLMSRCGMGLCQGRMCETSLLRLLAEHGIRTDPGFTARFPARPLPLSCLRSNKVTRAPLL
jgi:thioredoxin reductase